MFKFVLCLAGLCCVWAAGCAPIVPSPTPQPQTPATAVAALAASLTPTQKPTTATVVPMDTPMPTSRPSDTPTIWPTQTITVNPQAALTEQVFALRDTQIASFNTTCGDNVQNDISLSPDGDWLAISCGYNRDQILEIVSKDGKQLILQYKEYLDDVSKEDIPIGALYPRYWVDGDYLYFSSSEGFSGGGFCRFRWEGGQGLYRINLNTGTVSTTLPPLEGAAGYSIAFSPNGRWLAYYRSGYPTIQDIKTGNKITINIESGLIGDFTWSPDGSELAFATCEPVPNSDDVNKSSIQVYSLITHTSKTILEVEANPLHLFGNKNMLLQIANSESFDYRKATKWFYDWFTEQIFMVPPTLSP